MKQFIGKIGNLTPLIDEKGHPLYDKMLWHRIPLFDYRSVEPLLTYIDTDGTQYQLDNHFNTDGGSIPPGLRLIPLAHLDPFNFPRSYLFHDCGYQYGGLYVKHTGENVFRFRLLTRKKIDDLLTCMLPLEKATKYDIFLISTGVKIGGGFKWDDKKKPLKQAEERKRAGIEVYTI